MKVFQKQLKLGVLIHFNRFTNSMTPLIKVIFQLPSAKKTLTLQPKQQFSQVDVVGERDLMKLCQV